MNENKLLNRLGLSKSKGVFREGFMTFVEFSILGGDGLTQFGEKICKDDQNSL